MLKNANISKIEKSEPQKLSKCPFAKIDFTENMSGRKIRDFLHCEKMPKEELRSSIPFSSLNLETAIHL